VAFFVAAMSLVGLPPLSGFFGKLVIIREGWTMHWWLSAIGLATGALTLLSMLKIWTEGFWSPESGPAPARGGATTASLRPAHVGIGILVVAAVSIGLAAEPIYDIAFHAGEQLTDPSAYIQAVSPLAPDSVVAAIGGGG
jgi:multicomponent Na+:H+ antiporter subunit D